MEQVTGTAEKPKKRRAPLLEERGRLWSEEIRAYREALRLTMSEFAKLLGFKYDRVRGWERHPRAPWSKETRDQVRARVREQAKKSGIKLPEVKEKW